MSKYLPVILVVLCAAIGVACSSSNGQAGGGVTIEPITGSTTVVPTATLPAVLPTVVIVATQVSYDQAREMEPCKKGSVNYQYLIGGIIDPSFQIFCNGSTGDITVVILKTGDISAYRKVKTEIVDPEVCRLLPKGRIPWTLVIGPDLDKSMTPIEQQRVSDGRLVCS